MMHKAQAMQPEDHPDRKLEIALKYLEQQAQALVGAQGHIEQLEHAGSQDMLMRLGFGALRSRRTPLPALPRIVDRADWASPARGAIGLNPLSAYPGHGSALTQTVPHATIGYLIEGNDIARIKSFVRSVYLAQRDRRNFAPVFVTSCDRFDPFIANNYIFEYLPPYEKFAASREAYEVWRAARLAHIKAKWGISEVITYDSGVRTHAAGRPEGKPIVVVYPDYGRSNPYLDMMYSKLGDGFEVEFGDPKRAIELAQTGPVIFHLHWEDAVIRTRREDEFPLAMAEFVAAIDRFKALGGVFLWTVHNLDPHDVGERALSLEFSRQLYLRADRVHAHDQRAAAMLRARFGADKNITVIEHPSYGGCYPEKFDRTLARRLLDIGLEDDDQVFLWFGQVRRYKGIETLLNVAPSFIGRAKFIFAGRSGRYDPRSAPPRNCLCIQGHIDDDRLAALFSAADFFVLPFEEITASGSLMLAMSYALPVITPEYDILRNVVREGREGFLYEPGEGGRTLSAALDRALTAPPWQRNAMELSAAALAANRNPEAFGIAVRQLLEETSRSRFAGGALVEAALS